MFNARAVDEICTRYLFVTVYAVVVISLKFHKELNVPRIVRLKKLN